MCTVKQGNKETMQLLVQLGADVNKSNNAGLTGALEGGDVGRGGGLRQLTLRRAVQHLCTLL